MSQVLLAPTAGGAAVLSSTSLNAEGPSKERAAQEVQHSVSEVAGRALVSSISLGVVDMLTEVSSGARGSYGIVSHLTQEEAPLGMTALGMTSVLSAGLGAFAFYDNFKKIKTCEEVGDHFGKMQAGVRTVRGACVILGSSLYIPARALSIAAGVSPNPVYAQNAALISSIGSAFFGAVNVLAVVTHSMDLYRRASFRAELEKRAPDPQSAVTYLKELLIEKGSGYIIQVCGREGLNAIKSEKMKAEKVLEIVRRQNGCNIAISAASIVLALLGTAAMILTLIFTGGAPFLVAAILSIVITAGWLAIGIQNVARAFHYEEAGRYDMLVILLSAIVAFLVVSAAMILSASFVVPFVVAASVGVVWLVINLACLYRLKQIQAKQMHGPKLSL